VKSWPRPFLPHVPGEGHLLRLRDSVSGELIPATETDDFTMYVCGITPYDATHLGHAATYVTFDVLQRTIRDAGVHVAVVQNVTDVDDPLFERAERDGVDWRDLARQETDLFRDDMTALAVIPPDEFVGVEESMATIADAVAELLANGTAYAIPVEATTSEPAAVSAAARDVYLDLGQRDSFGQVSGWTREQMDEVFAERGGDPDRIGKRDRFDPLLWRAARRGEPSWEHPALGAGRPGWHIECTAITRAHLGLPFDVQGGGTDLLFPHHEMSAAQAEALGGGSGRPGSPDFARIYVHQGMVGYEGHKMSKSRGNLVLVSRLRAEGVDPMAIRLVLLAHHHASDWEYSDEQLDAARDRLARWRTAVSGNTAPPTEELLEEIRRTLADDLDTPAALAAVDAWAHRSLAQEGDDPTAAGVLARALDALLGIRL